MPGSLQDEVTYTHRLAKADQLVAAGKPIPPPLWTYLRSALLKKNPQHRPATIKAWRKKIAIGSSVQSLRWQGVSPEDAIERAGKKHHVAEKTARNAYTYYRSIFGMSLARGRPRKK